MGKFSKLLDERIGGGTDSRWCVFATSFSIGWAFMAFAVSFYFASGGGDMMATSGFLIAAWIFGIIGFILLVFSIFVAFRWFLNPLQNTMPQQIAEMREEMIQGFKATQDSIQELTKEIRNLVEEIRRDRNERNKSR